MNGAMPEFEVDFLWRIICLEKRNDFGVLRIRVPDAVPHMKRNVPHDYIYVIYTCINNAFIVHGTNLIIFAKKCNVLLSETILHKRRMFMNQVYILCLMYKYQM